MAPPASQGSLWEQATSTRGGRWAVGVAIAGLCAVLAGGGIALAASARADRSAAVSSTSRDQGGTTKPDDEKPDDHKNASQGAGADLNAIPGRLKGVSHGEVTRPAASGGTETLLVQTGSVTASSDTSVTVTSTDGFAETYAVSASTTVRGPAKAGGLAVGTQVTVVAAKEGKAALLLATKGKPS